MVPYSVNKNIRYTVYLAIFLLALVLRDALEFLSPTLGQLSSWVNGLTLVGLIGALFLVFDRFLWRVPGKFGFPIVPDFAGQYYGYIVDRESFVEGQSPGQFVQATEPPFPVSVAIEQTFTDIGVWLRPEGRGRTIDRGRESDCTMASVDMAAPRRPRLQYSFRLSGKPDITGLVCMQWLRNDREVLLHGFYISDAMKRARIDLVRLQRSRSKLCCGEISVLSNKTGDQYVGVIVDKKAVLPFARQLQRTVGRKRLRVLARNQEERDGEDRHLTIIEPSEYSQVRSQADVLERFNRNVGRLIWIELTELGQQCCNGAQTYYVIANSVAAEGMRADLRLRPKDFHVTLGFDPRDVHGVPKGPSTRM